LLDQLFSTIDKRSEIANCPRTLELIVPEPRLTEQIGASAKLLSDGLQAKEHKRPEECDSARERLRDGAESVVERVLHDA
jgi:hypothetical protein